jgi:hypothetical protein
VRSEQMNRQPSGVVVLGMHRSGTSAFAGILAKAGLFAGRDADMLPAASDNPAGFFERFDVNGLNNELLAELGGAWDNPPPRHAVLEQAPVWRARVEKVLEAMAEDAGGRPLVLKDPRIGLLLPAWLPALGDRFAFVLVHRNPLEVAMSMHKRDGQPVYAALALWQLYYADLLNGLAGQRVWFARYESLLQNPAQHASALLDGLKGQLASGAGGAGAGGVFNDGADAVAFVVSELRHQHAAPMSADIERVFTGGQLALWQWLCQLPEGWVTLDAPSKLRSQPKEALASAAEYYALVGESAPTPVTVRGALRLAHHHYHEGGLPQVVKRAARMALSLARQRYGRRYRAGVLGVGRHFRCPDRREP